MLCFLLFARLHAYYLVLLAVCLLELASGGCLHRNLMLIGGSGTDPWLARKLVWGVNWRLVWRLVLGLENNALSNVKVLLKKRRFEWTSSVF